MNLLITGAWADAQNYIEQIEAAGHTVLFLQQEGDALPCDCSWPEGVICNGLFLHHPLACFTSLRYIQLTSAGYDRVPMEEVRRRGIEIHNARGVYSVPMAEYALAGVLSLLKEMPQFQRQQQEHRWAKIRTLRELQGRRVLILGCGSVGTECAKRFKAFGCTVVGLDAVKVESGEGSFFDETRVLTLGQEKESAVLDEELVKADIVVLTLPLTEETRGLIDGQRLELIGKEGILVNIARGALVEQKALEKWDGAAVLDVFEEEPLGAESPLWEKERMILTPHNCFVGEGDGVRLTEVILINLKGERVND